MQTEEFIRRLQQDVVDSYDEELELELELEDRPFDAAGTQVPLRDEERRERRLYFRELLRLQGELVKLQDWVVATGHRMVIVFEGRDAAGKGGVIKRITQRLNPRVCRTCALPAPNDRERTQWYFQRYVAHLPAAGEIVLFDRSWYNRAGVERVMGFCSDEQYEEFFRSAPEFERMLVRSGIQLVKYWFSISDEEQHLRFLSRMHDPLKQWKLSPMDLESRRRWEDYTRAKEAMLERTHIAEAPWWVVQADDKKKARLNCIAHLLEQVPYRPMDHDAIALPERVRHDDYSRRPVPPEMFIPEKILSTLPETEFELKFQVPPESRAAVEAALRRGPVRRQRLRARYFDSSDEALARAGLTLRLRQEGRAWVQTAKGQGKGAFERLEHNVGVDADGSVLPDLQLHEGQEIGVQLREALHGESLQPRFETDVTRLSRVIEAGGTAVELALDQGRIRAQGRTHPVSELEFELKQGSPAAVVELAQRWSEKHGLWLDPLSKAGAGHRLAHDVVEAAAVRARMQKPARRSTAALLAAALGSALQQVLGNAREIAVGAYGPEHVHQLRVGLRRLRTVLRELRGLPALARLDPEVEPTLQALFALLGRHRDLSTLLPALQQEVAAAGAPVAPWQPEWPDLPAAVRATPVQSALLQLVAFIQELEQPTEAEGWKEARQLVRARLRKLHRQSLRAGRDFAGLAPDERHRVRKRVKRLRYLAELVRPLFAGRAVDRFVDALEDLQDALGRYQDLAAGRALFEERAATDGAAWFGAGWLAAREEECAKACEQACRKAAKKAEAFWD